ncbi:S41 family peptidase [Marinomonas agarivorans]|nr:S41 family peptidase [Marinomonas agarivorans]
MSWLKHSTLTIALIAMPHLAAAKESAVPLSEIQSFVESFEMISQGYVTELSDRDILNKTLKGMVSALDPHSEYLTKEEVEEFSRVTSGKYAGIGVEIEIRNNQLTVIAPIGDSPAALVGILAGDRILRIDGTLVNGMGLQEVITLMRGKAGTEIQITVAREEDIKEFTITRELIQSFSVTNKWLDNDIAYIRITQFQGSTGNEFEKALLNMQEEKTLQGLVLDLRNNPGGVLQGAVAVVDALLQDGLIVYTDGRHKTSKTQFNATQNQILGPVPIVVLVNSGSASASEIVAGALQDHKRAVIMGSETFGKGSVQTVIPLTDGSAMKLTTALYFTPNGRSIQAQGIIPDMIVPQAELVLEESSFFVKEADLNGHLANGRGGKDKNSIEVNETLDEVATTDFQLFQALSVLKAFPKLATQ